MSDQGQNFFEKVSTRVDRERVYNILVERQLTVSAVNEKRQSMQFLPKYLVGHHLVLIGKYGTEAWLGAPVIINFEIGNEKYFLKTELSESTGTEVKLDLQSELYKLQRRNSFRLNIPVGFTAKVEIKARSSQPCRERYDLVDLSGGGFAFETPPGHKPPYNRGEELFVKINVGTDFQCEAAAIVRHSRAVGSRGSGILRIGLEFAGLRPREQEQLVTLVMGLHREMFSKFKTR